MSLTRDEVLVMNKPVMQEMDVPAWGGSVWLRSVPLGEALQLLEQEGDEHRGLMLLERAVVDEEGNRLFVDGDVRNLQFTAAVDDLLAKAIELNPLFQRTGDDEEGN